MKEYTSNLDAHEDPARAMSLNELRYQLANEDVYTSPYVRKWLERTPPGEAADILAEIAKTAQPEPHSFLHMAYHGVMMLIRTSDVVSDKNPSGRKAGTRAAMLLAVLNDPRCIPPLVRVFETSPVWQGRYQDAVEAALLRFLSGPAEQHDLRPYAPYLRDLAACIWKIGNGRGEISSRRSDLLLVTLRHLAQIGEEQDASLFRAIADAAVNAPNRSLVKEAAALLIRGCNAPPLAPPS